MAPWNKSLFNNPQVEIGNGDTRLNEVTAAFTSRVPLHVQEQVDDSFPHTLSTRCPHAVHTHADSNQ